MPATEEQRRRGSFFSFFTAAGVRQMNAVRKKAEREGGERGSRAFV